MPLLAALLPLRQATVRSLVEKVGLGIFWSIQCVKAIVAHVLGVCVALKSRTPSCLLFHLSGTVFLGGGPFFYSRRDDLSNCF